jgi:hypothetical protein
MISDRITTRIAVTWDIPWWWPLVRWIPMFQAARRLGHEEERAATVVFFRRKAVEYSKHPDGPGLRNLYDAWADFFAGPRAG